jgi:hypothetical protein
LSSAELTAWARVDGLHLDAVSKALWGDGSLVKLWAMRGTLHLLPARDLGMWLGALGSYETTRELTREELAVEVERSRVRLG